MKETKRKFSYFFKPYGCTRAEDVIFIFGWIIISVLLAAALIDGIFPKAIQSLSLPCPVNFLTGYFCPGCGGTRAFKALLRGDILLSIAYHPVVIYLAAAGGIFMVSQTLERVTGGCVHGMRYRNVYLYVLAGLYILNFAVKNTAAVLAG